MGSPTTKDFSIIIPAYNEGERLPVFLTELARELSSLPFSGDILVVDDGSSPAHHAHYQKAIDNIKDPRVRLLTMSRNRGKGAAIRYGFSEATGSWVGFADADGATPAGEVVRLLRKAFSSKDLSGIFGSRVHMLGYRIDRKATRHYIGRVFVTLSHALLGYIAYDSQCGCKFFRRQELITLLPLCQEDGFLLDVELIALGHRSGLRFLEVPIHWTDIPGSKVSVIKDGIRMCLGLWRIRHRLKTLHSLDG